MEGGRVMTKKFDWNAPLYCNAYIAATIGAEAGIVYERLRWMIQDCVGKKTEFGTLREDGRRWVDFTYAQLIEWLPIFKSTKALRDTITRLEKSGLLESESIEGTTKWYTISNLDPATLTKIVRPDPDENRQTPCLISSDHPDENRQTTLTKNDTPPDENRQTLIYIDTESTPKQQSETTTDSSSSDLPPVVIQHRPVEEEKLTPSAVESLDTEVLLIQSLAKLCKVSVKDTKLPHIIRQIRETDPQVTPGDFRYFQAYYDVVRDKGVKGDKYTYPFPLYVLNGWVKFKAWWQEHSEDSILGTLPGCGESLHMPRWFWVSLDELPVGDGVLSHRFGQQVFYAKQADGRFTEIEPDHWPAWTRAEVQQSA